MSLALADSLRSDRANRIILAINSGAGNGALNLYSSPQPAKGAALTTQILLATCTFADPAGTVSNGVLTLNLSGDDVADNNGIAVWARVLDGDDAFVMDMRVTDNAGSGPVKLANTQIYAGVALPVISAQLTEGNG